MDWLWVILVAIRAVSSDPGDQWATRLAELDRVRAEAFATGDSSRLREVYSFDSPALRADRLVIDAYARRDGRVQGAELRVLSCRVLHARNGRVRLDVVDQLAPARVAWGDGTSTRLPVDRPTRRVVTLRRTEAGWRIETSGQG